MNKQMKLFITSIILFAIFVSCGSYDPCNQYAVSYGMSIDEVKEILGYPDYVGSAFDRTYFVYYCEEELWIGFEANVVAYIKKY